MLLDCPTPTKMLENCDPTGAGNTAPGLTDNCIRGAIMANAQIIPIPPRVKDHSGNRFGRLTVIGYIGTHKQPSGHGRARFLCQCDCGTMHEAFGQNLTAGLVKSCGCLASDNARKMHALHLRERKPTGPVTHGKSRTPEHNAWSGMKQRCYNPNNNRYAWYGARGITVCDRWRNSFEAFLEDMGPRPSPKHSIDRIDVDGNYEPGNLRWATDVEQANNKTSNRMIRVGGKMVSISEAEKLTGISQKLIGYRLKNDWPESDLLLPVTWEKRHPRK